MVSTSLKTLLLTITGLIEISFYFCLKIYSLVSLPLIDIFLAPIQADSFLTNEMLSKVQENVCKTLKFTNLWTKL